MKTAHRLIAAAGVASAWLGATSLAYADVIPPANGGGGPAALATPVAAGVMSILAIAGLVGVPLALRRRRPSEALG
ncbi:hypothetical protein WMF20_35970 [Sorangium sp. So ce834]|uniref:hypothetical protein n=1 Tax=Sorangium sp. So ce834 TaxID=3133321 RepID=UPI003F5D920B